jgi:hypothetical protein
MQLQPNTKVHGEFSLALINPRSRRILVSIGEGKCHLPTVQIPSGRMAQLLTHAIETKYGLRTIHLALSPRGPWSGCAVHEVLSTSGPNSGLVEVDLEHVGRDALNKDERDLLLRIIEGRDTNQGRFARLGWVDELRNRIDSCLAHRNQKLTGLVRHFNGGIDFSLLWLHTDSGPNLWFKAVGEPNAREFAITMELAQAFPTVLPHIVCAMPDWNGWLAEDADGPSLSALGDYSAAAATLRALARIQQAAIELVPKLHALGAVDWTLLRVLTLKREFFAEMPSIMAAQTSSESKRLTSSELSLIQTALQDVVTEFMAIGIPNTLVHGDIGHGNIKMTDRGPVFLDWAETYIGPPSSPQSTSWSIWNTPLPIYRENIAWHFAMCISANGRALQSSDTWHPQPGQCLRLPPLPTRS